MTYIPRIWCSCGGEMRPERIGVTVEAVVESNNSSPYYKIQTDILMCVDCQSTVLLPAQQPLAHHYQVQYLGIQAERTVRLT